MGAKEIVGNENNDDVQLLNREPNKLILKYQEIVKTIVRKYISSGMFRAADFDDIVQSINESLIVKIPNIQRQYNGTALLKTYFSAIVRNICLKEYDKHKHEIPTTNLTETIFSPDGNPEDQLEIENHIKRLDVILQLYSRKRPKLVFHLKLYFRFIQTRKDIIRYLSGCSPKDEEKLLARFGKDYDSMTLQEIYSYVTPLINKYEGKENSSDTARRWIDEKVEEILTILNGRPRRFNYNKETLKILAEKYFLRLESRKEYI